ncbi:MAG: ferrochelatase [Phycisphaeraceae bacterium]|nr:ferrochelatase [Phycisphaeraceae bacterium]
MHEDRHDAILIVSFGGPEGPDEVMPFLRNVVRGRNVPEERLAEVAEHYHRFGGVSPHNRQIRDLIKALKPELAGAGIDLPVYWGNRNWDPMLRDTVRQMTEDGIRRAIGFVVSGYSSYSSCRQYRQNIAEAIEAAGPEAPRIEKIRVFFNHPDFIEAMRDRVRQALGALGGQASAAPLLFTAHSIPTAMAAGCDYTEQLTEASRLVAEPFEGHPWELVYQSRSGPPQVPWLEPDVCDRLEQLHAETKPRSVVLVPIGFLSDHLEVLFDLDIEAAEVCQSLGMTMARASTVGTHPGFVRMIRKLIEERMNPGAPREAIGRRPARPDDCPEGCCPPGRPAGRPDVKGRP